MEIRKYVDFINKSLINKYLTDVKIVNGRYKKKQFELYDLLKKALPLKLLQVKTKGKFIYFEFENNIYILNTLGLSGGWAYKTNNAKTYDMPKLLSYIEESKTESYLMRSLEHINIEFIFDVGTLAFFDTLSYGTIKVINSLNELNKKLNSIGPDIMDDKTTLDVFKTKIKSNSNINKSIGIVLVNQSLISGIGNYIRSEVLWLAGINPFKKVKELTDDEFKKLFNACKIITWGNYDRENAIKNNIIKKTDKIPCDYKRDFFVYKENTDIFDNPITKEELYEGNQKRFIYWVKNVQF